jgi:HB1, ASXL, restriction endonuclease HTH domain
MRRRNDSRPDTLPPVTFLQAAQTVLRSARQPMTAAEITDAALRRGLLKSRGKTPIATMTARLYGRPSNSPIRREFTPGRWRAKRGSVRWTYDRNTR